MSSVQITKFNFFQKNTKHTEYFCITDYKIDSDLNLGIEKAKEEYA